MLMLMHILVWLTIWVYFLYITYDDLSVTNQFLSLPVRTLTRSPVWRNNGVSLMFHIPSTNIKGRVRVCVLLPDGSCHGNVTITYRSSPSCTNIIPNSTWIRYESIHSHCYISYTNIDFDGNI